MHKKQNQFNNSLDSKNYFMPIPKSKIKNQKKKRKEENNTFDKRKAESIWQEYINKNFPESIDHKSIVKIRVLSDKFAIVFSIFGRIPNKRSVGDFQMFELISSEGEVREISKRKRTENQAEDILDFIAIPHGDMVTITLIAKYHVDKARSIFSFHPNIKSYLNLINSKKIETKKNIPAKSESGHPLSRFKLISIFIKLKRKFKRFFRRK